MAVADPQVDVRLGGTIKRLAQIVLGGGGQEGVGLRGSDIVFHLVTDDDLVLPPVRGADIHPFENASGEIVVRNQVGAPFAQLRHGVAFLALHGQPGRPEVGVPCAQGSAGSGRTVRAERASRGGIQGRVDLVDQAIEGRVADVVAHGLGLGGIQRQSKVPHRLGVELGFIPLGHVVLGDREPARSRVGQALDLIDVDLVGAEEGRRQAANQRFPAGDVGGFRGGRLIGGLPSVRLVGPAARIPLPGRVHRGAAEVVFEDVVRGLEIGEELAEIERIEAAGAVGVVYLGLILVDLERVIAVLRAEHHTVVGGGSFRWSQRVVQRADAPRERLEILRLVVERAELDRRAIAEKFRKVCHDTPAIGVVFHANVRGGQGVDARVEENLVLAVPRRGQRPGLRRIGAIAVHADDGPTPKIPLPVGRLGFGGEFAERGASRVVVPIALLGVVDCDRRIDPAPVIGRIL